MKICKIIFPFFLILFFACNDDSAIRTDLQKKYLIDNVKEIIEVRYKVLNYPDSNMQKVQTEKTKVCFNEIGYITAEYMIDSNIINPSWEKLCSDSLDRDGYPLKKKNTKTQKFDEKGNLVEWMIIPENPDLKIKLFYDDKNRLVKEITYCKDSLNGISGSWDYVYNNKGLEIERIHKDAHGNIQECHKSKYDLNGNITSIKRTLYGVDYPNEKYAYTIFDSNGNWKIQYHYENEKMVEIIEREISYYE